MLAFQSDTFIQNFYVHKILTGFLPRTIEHTVKVRTLAQIYFVKIPHFAQRHNSNVGILLLLKKRLVDVLGGGKQSLSEAKL